MSSLRPRVQDRDPFRTSTASRVAMNFKQAAQFVLPYGSHKGRSIDSVASTDEGLLDLDSFLDWLEENRPGTDVHGAINTYLSDPTIEKELKAL